MNSDLTAKIDIPQELEDKINEKFRIAYDSIKPIVENITPSTEVINLKVALELIMRIIVEQFGFNARVALVESDASWSKILSNYKNPKYRAYHDIASKWEDILGDPLDADALSSGQRRVLNIKTKGDLIVLVRKSLNDLLEDTELEDPFTEEVFAIQSLLKPILAVES